MYLDPAVAMNDWLWAFGLTEAVEVPIYLALLRLPWPRRLGAAFGTSALTHPCVWFVLPGLLVPLISYWGYLAVAESFAILLEALVCRSLGAPWPRAFTASLVANAASCCVGLLVL
jgi:hypothetical protein